VLAGGYRIRSAAERGCAEVTLVGVGAVILRYCVPRTCQLEGGIADIFSVTSADLLFSRILLLLGLNDGDGGGSDAPPERPLPIVMSSACPGIFGRSSFVWITCL